MSLLYKIYKKGDNELAHVWGSRVIKHLLNGKEVPDIDTDTEYIRDEVIFWSEDELKEAGFKLISQT